MRIKQLSWFPGQGWDVVAPSDEIASADFVLYFFGPGLEDLSARLAELGEKFPGAALVGCSTGGEIIADEVLNRVYFEKRSFSSSGSRRSLTQRRSATA